MKKEITDKTKCVIFKNGFKTFITEEEYQELKAKFNNGADIAIIGKGRNEKMISRVYFAYAMEAGEVDREERMKRGDWQCKYGFWHKRGEECAHNIHFKNYTFKK